MNSLTVVSQKSWVWNGRPLICKTERKKKSLSQIMTYTHVFIIILCITVLGTIRPFQKKKKTEWHLCPVLTAQWYQHKWDLQKAFYFSELVPGWQNRHRAEGHTKCCFSTHLMSRFSSVLWVSYPSWGRGVTRPTDLD